MDTIFAGSLYVPAFQAGCRGFEPRLPLFVVDRSFRSRSEAASREASGEEARRERSFVWRNRGQRQPVLFLGNSLPPGGEQPVPKNALPHEKSLFPRVFAVISSISVSLCSVRPDHCLAAPGRKERDGLYSVYPPRFFVRQTVGVSLS